MILVEFTPDGSAMQRISTEDVALDYQWYSYIKSISSIKLQLPDYYGGYAAPSFSDITINLEAYAGIWPPPAMSTVKIIETETDETSGVTIFEGSANTGDITRNGVSIYLKKPDLDITVVSGAAYNDTLVNVATALCGPTILNLTINTTLARSPSPAVLHTTTSDQPAIDLLSNMCAFFSHAFQIIGDTLYLVDMLGTQTPYTLTEFDVQPCDYRRADPILLVKNGDSYSVDGSSPNGEEVNISKAFHTTEANILTALGNIKMLLEKDIAVIRFKTSQTKPRILEQVTLLDESMILPITFTGIITSIIYNYETMSVEAEVIGSMTA